MNLNENPPGSIRVSIADMTALRVRAPKLNARLPEFLYQKLPAAAMALIATLPRGDIQVSIPHIRKPDSGYLIEKTFPPAGNGFVLIYTPQPSRCYQAVKVYHQGRTYEIEQFHAFASQWTEIHWGKMQAAPGRFLYLKPSVEEWGTILRDSGYVAADPSCLPSEIPPALKAHTTQLESGVFARMPLQTGDKQPFESATPFFSRVELTLDRNPGDQSHWLKFEEYQRDRSRKFRPPETILEDFRIWQDRLMKESGFESWNFTPGMLFADCLEWWGNRNRRRTEHEGIDYAQGKKPDGGIQDIPAGTPIRAMADGEIIAVLADFLGKTIVVRHAAIRNEDSDTLHTLYSHIQPEESAAGRVSKGQMLGKIGEAKTNKAPMHLHLTAAWIPQSIRPDELTMNHIHPGFAPIALVDFGIAGSAL